MKNLIFILCAALGATTLAAADGRIPISSTPFTISAPGRYYVTRDLSLASGNVIQISAEPVDLDLDGHTLTTLSGNPVNVSSASVRIYNGRLQGGSSGINIYNSTATRKTVVIEALVMTDQTYAGVNAGGVAGATFQVDIRDNLITLVGTACNAGIYLTKTYGSRIEGNTVRGCRNSVSGGYGIYVAGNENHVAGNSASYCTGNGYSLVGDNNVLIGNSAAANTGYGGVLAGNYNVYRGNTGPGNTAGAFIASGTNNASGGDNCFSGPPATVVCN